MIGPRAARFAVALLAAALVSSCVFGPDTAKPSPSPTISAGPTRPKLALSTYQYALQTKGRIRVGVSGGGPPMSTERAGGRYEGFEPDLAREIAKAIWGRSDDPDAHIEWRRLVSPSSRLTALTGDQADLVIADLAMSDATAQVIDLSATYLTVGQRLLVKKTNAQIKEVADVAGGEQTVCAVKGSAADANLRAATNDRAKILELPTLDFCLQALASGAADAVTANELALYALAFKDPTTHVVAKAFDGERLAIGVKKNANAGRQGFLDFVNGVLARIVADGTWAGLYGKDVTPLSGDRKQLPTD